MLPRCCAAACNSFSRADPGARLRPRPLASFNCRLAAGRRNDGPVAVRRAGRGIGETSAQAGRLPVIATAVAALPQPRHPGGASAFQKLRCKNATVRRHRGLASRRSAATAALVTRYAGPPSGCNLNPPDPISCFSFRTKFRNSADIRRHFSISWQTGKRGGGTVYPDLGQSVLSPPVSRISTGPMDGFRR
jgi:hypothetical protein